MRRWLRALAAVTVLQLGAATATLVVRSGGADPDSSVAAAAPAASCVDRAAAASLPKAVLACVSRSLAFVDTPFGTGSGILLEGGFVVTNAHVVVPFGAADVSFAPGERHRRVPVKGVDLDADLALLGPVDTDREPLPLADGDSLVKGDDLFLVGYPGEVDEEPEPTISQGILSRTRLAKEFGLTFLQTDAAIGGGQSGGALVDDHGRVVGISGYAFAEEFALALSGADARRSVERIRAGELAPYRPFPEDGLVTAGSFTLADDEAFQVLTLSTGDEDRTVRLTLPADARPAVLVTDFEGADVYFQNREAVEAMAAEAGLDPDDLAGDDEVDEAVAPGVFEFEVPADTWAVIVVATRLPGGATMAFESTVALGRYDDGDDDAVVRVGDRVAGVVDGLETGDTYLLDLAEGEEVEIFAGSATGDVGYTVRGPGVALRDEVVVDDSDVGLFRVDAEDTFEPEVAGVHRITVFSADGRATGYVLKVRHTEP